MRIASALIDEIVAHSRDEAPNECCGVVSGSDGRATEVLRARNAAASPLRFEIHPSDQIRITEQIEGRGEEIAAIYHSHTKSAAEPSQTDINMARWWPDPLWIICSIAAGSEPQVRAFSIRDGSVSEVELQVE